MKKCKREVVNSKGLKFSFHFRPFSQTLEISCKNAPGLGFISAVENVTKSLNLDVEEYGLMGIIYKCSSYKHFELVTDVVAAT